MQRVLITALVVLSVFLGWWALDLRGRLSSAEGALLSLRAEYDGAKKETALAQTAADPLRANIARLTEERDSTKASANAQPLAETVEPQGQEPNLLGGLLEKMDSPEMRKMLRGRAVAEARKEYAALMKKWALSPGDAEQFIQLVADRDFSGIANGMTFLKDGALDEKKIAEMEAKDEAHKQENDARMKSLLGEKRAAELESFDWDKEQQDTVSRYSDHLTTAGFPLDAHQQQELAKIIRIADAETQGDSSSRRETEDLAVLTSGMSDEAVAAARLKDEAQQRRVIDRAAGLLNPDQISALQAAYREENDERETATKFAAQIMKSGALKDAPPAGAGGSAQGRR